MDAYFKKTVSLAGSPFIKSVQPVMVRGIIVILLILLLNIFNNPVKNIFHLASSPVSNVFLGMGENTQNFFSSFINNRFLQQENDNLKEENQTLLMKIMLLENTLGEQKTLEEGLQQAHMGGYKLLMGKVMSIDLSQGLIAMNKGKDHGIAESMPVISSQGVVYGKVVKVYDNFSHIMLISSKNNVLDIKVKNEDPSLSSIHGVIKGLGGVLAYMDLVDSNAKIAENDVIITSGLNGTFPPDLLVGKITSVDKNDLKPFQTARVELFFNPQNAENLFVITDYLR